MGLVEKMSQKLGNILPNAGGQNNSNIRVDAYKPARKPTKIEQGVTAVTSKITKKLILRVVWALAVVIILVIAGVVCAKMLQDQAQKPITMSEELIAKLSNSLDVLKTYNKKLYSSQARSVASSLYDTLNSTNLSLVGIMEENYNYDENTAKKSETWTDAEEEAGELEATLENARLNGILDQTYAREAILLIAEITATESEISARTDNADLIALFEGSTASLEVVSTSLEALQVSWQAPAVGYIRTYF